MIQRVPDGVVDPRRLGAVRRFLSLHRSPSPVLDRLTALAAQLLEAPISLLTLVDHDTQYIVSAYGLPEPVATLRRTGLEYSICQHAVASARPLIVTDARGDEVLRHNASVTEYGVTSYAGMPLLTWERHAVGTLCVIDLVVRDWTGDQLASLSHLADIAMEEMLGDIDLVAGDGDGREAVAGGWRRP